MGNIKPKIEYIEEISKFEEKISFLNDKALDILTKNVSIENSTSLNEDLSFYSFVEENQKVLCIKSWIGNGNGNDKEEEGGEGEGMFNEVENYVRSFVNELLKNNQLLPLLYKNKKEKEFVENVLNEFSLKDSISGNIPKEIRSTFVEDNCFFGLFKMSSKGSKEEEMEEEKGEREENNEEKIKSETIYDVGYVFKFTEDFFLSLRFLEMFFCIKKYMVIKLLKKNSKIMHDELKRDLKRLKKRINKVEFTESLYLFENVAESFLRLFESIDKIQSTEVFKMLEIQEIFYPLPNSLYDEWKLLVKGADLKDKVMKKQEDLENSKLFQKSLNFLAKTDISLFKQIAFKKEYKNTEGHIDINKDSAVKILTINTDELIKNDKAIQNMRKSMKLSDEEWNKIINETETHIYQSIEKVDLDKLKEKKKYWVYNTDHNKKIIFPQNLIDYCNFLDRCRICNKVKTDKVGKSGFGFCEKHIKDSTENSKIMEKVIIPFNIKAIEKKKKKDEFYQIFGEIYPRLNVIQSLLENYKFDLNSLSEDRIVTKELFTSLIRIWKLMMIISYRVNPVLKSFNKMVYQIGEFLVQFIVVGFDILNDNNEDRKNPFFYSYVIPFSYLVVFICSILIMGQTTLYSVILFLKMQKIPKWLQFFTGISIFLFLPLFTGVASSLIFSVLGGTIVLLLMVFGEAIILFIMLIVFFVMKFRKAKGIIIISDENAVYEDISQTFDIKSRKKEARKSYKSLKKKESKDKELK